MTSEAEVHLTFAYSVDDWKRVIQLAESRNPHSWRDWLFTLIYVLIGGYELYLGLTLLQLYFAFGSLLSDAIRNLLYALPWIALAAFTWFNPVRMVHNWWEFRKMARKTPKTYEFVFSPLRAEFHMISGQTREEVKVSWHVFSRLLENKDVMLLERFDRGFWAIPKSHFATNEELETFRRLAQEGIHAETTATI